MHQIVQNAGMEGSIVVNTHHDLERACAAGANDGFAIDRMSGGGWRQPLANGSIEHAQKLFDAGSLREEVRRSHPPRDLRKVRPSGHEHHGYLLLARVVNEHLARHTGAAQDRHVDIEHDDVRQRRATESLQSFVAVACGAHLVAHMAQNLCHGFYAISIVVNEQ